MAKEVKAPRTTDDKTATRESRQDQVDCTRLENKLGFRVRMVERAIYRLFIKSVGITPVQYSMFALVADNEGMSQGTIGEALNMDRASTMAIMNKLESEGLIERRQSPVDRRRHALYLSEKGKNKIIEVENKVCETENVFKQRLSDKQLKEFTRCLQLLRSDSST